MRLQFSPYSTYQYSSFGDIHLVALPPAGWVLLLAAQQAQLLVWRGQLAAGLPRPQPGLHAHHQEVVFVHFVRQPENKWSELAIVNLVLHITC